MKRLAIFSITIVIILVTLLSGCSSKPEEKPSVTKETTKQEESQVINHDEASKLKEFTLEELAQYNGTNGKPAYVAVKGIVYDVTDAKLWKGGVHSPAGSQSIAGKDLTEALAEAPPSHQNQEIWDKLPKVGVLK